MHCLCYKPCNAQASSYPQYQAAAQIHGGPSYSHTNHYNAKAKLAIPCHLEPAETRTSGCWHNTQVRLLEATPSAKTTEQLQCCFTHTADDPAASPALPKAPTHIIPGSAADCASTSAPSTSACDCTTGATSGTCCCLRLLHMSAFLNRQQHSRHTNALFKNLSMTRANWPFFAQ